MQRTIIIAPQEQSKVLIPKHLNNPQQSLPSKNAVMGKYTGCKGTKISEKGKQFFEKRYHFLLCPPYEIPSSSGGI